MRLRTLDLFSGIGGFALGLKRVCRTVAYCEIDERCIQILVKNVRTGVIDSAPVLGDVTTLRKDDLLPKKIEFITAGFPCQDISIANQSGEGLEGDRSGLFFEILRMVDMCAGVRGVLLENSPNILKKGIDVVVREFSSRGFKVVWSIFSAKEVGLPHLRRRWVALAYKPGFRMDDDRCTRARRAEPTRVIPYMSVAKRCGTLGNAVVPQCMCHALKALYKSIDNPVESSKGPGHVLLVNDGVVGYRKLPKVPTPPTLRFSDKGMKRTRDLWVTPLRSPSFWHRYVNMSDTFLMFLPGQVVHELGSRDQIRKITGGKIDKSAVMVNPDFVEWLMGYPKDYTSIL